MQYLAIAVGAALGANARYLVGVYVAQRFGVDFPWGTFFINVSGSVVIGFFMTLILDRFPVDVAWRLFFVTGFLGGYTTFSSYSYEALTLLLRGEVTRALVYLLGSVVAGVLGAFVGAVCAQWVTAVWPAR
jgi:fluoride exporter